MRMPTNNDINAGNSLGKLGIALTLALSGAAWAQPGGGGGATCSSEARSNCSGGTEGRPSTA